jgi:RimJ/RimL family protein N-acetyltransferase
MTEIVTKNLVLQPVEEEHIPFIQKFYNDDAILKFMAPPVPCPYPPDGAKDFVKNILHPEVQAGTHYGFIIYRNGEPLGSVGSKLEDEDAGEWQRGFWLAAPYRGLRQKIMEEASWALVKHVFAQTKARLVVSENAPLNGASARISSNQGFQLHGLIPKIPPYHNGEKVSMKWVMTRENFERLTQ